MLYKLSWCWSHDIPTLSIILGGFTALQTLGCFVCFVLFCLLQYILSDFGLLFLLIEALIELAEKDAFNEKVIRSTA